MAGGLRRAGHAFAQTGRAVARTSRGAARTGRRVGEGAVRTGRWVGQTTRRMTYAQGAGRSGLGRLIEISAGHSAGDALVTISLAGTLFIGMSPGQARGQVALYLLITMVPFTVVAPFVGPVLDRFRSGRRYVMAGTLLARGLLCWGMASSVVYKDTLSLFPAALAVLVLSKAYNVSRAAITPSVLPADITLVTANARVTLFALVSAGVAAATAAGLTAWVGAQWTLRLAMVLFLITGVMAVRLPSHVDSPDPEDPDERPIRSLFNVGPVVGESMWANVAIRLQGGFLVFFMLFLVQDKHLTGLAPGVTLGLLAVAAGGGGLLGAVAASWARSHSPQLIVLGMLALTTLTTIVSAFFFNVWTAVGVSLMGAFAQGLGKLALDAIVQREIGEEIRSSTFGVVESVLQLAWVFGGLIGLLMSLFAQGPLALAVVGAGLAVSLVWLLVRRRVRVRSRALARQQPATNPQ